MLRIALLLLTLATPPALARPLDRGGADQPEGAA